MARRQLNSSNSYSRCSNHSHSSSFSSRVPGWSPNPSLNTYKGLRTYTTGNSPFPSHSHWCPPSSRIPLGKGCTDSKGGDTNHLTKVPSRPSCHQNGPRVTCTDRPSSPTFLDQLIKGINYLDRSGIFSSTQSAQALSLPKLAASYLEKAANSLYLDNLENSSSHSYPSPSARMGPDHFPENTCIVPSARDNTTIQYLGDSTSSSSQHSSLRTGGVSQKTDTKLPELPLLNHGLLTLSRLPKLWEAMRSSLNASEPVSKPPNWW